MLTLNTNLSSLITQRSMKTSTNKLNQAIERMTTGFKINHAKDNAANYSITTNMTTKIGSYNVAEDNCAMGLDMISTAEGSLNQIQDKLTRLRTLTITAQNDTYGTQSLNALETEANSIVSEIKREYSSAEYNGLKLFNTENEEVTNDMEIATFSLRRSAVIDESKRVSNVTSFTSGETYYICDSADLVALQDLVNAGNDGKNSIFELTEDIDMQGVSFIGIGRSSDISFRGTFNGNGHTISNLYIDNRERNESAGLFTYTSHSTIQSLNIANCQIYGTFEAGAIVAFGSDLSITDCYVTGNIEGGQGVGGIAGALPFSVADDIDIGSIFTNCSFVGNVKGHEDTGGLIGSLSPYSTLENCNTNVNVIGDLGDIGGLVGAVDDNCSITHCSSKGSVSTNLGPVGGLIGKANSGENIFNCYSTANVVSSGKYSAGGLIGRIGGNTSPEASIVSECYSTGNVDAPETSGGFIGTTDPGVSINNCYSTGDVSGKTTGGFIGYLHPDTTIDNCYSTGDVKSNNTAGGFIGRSSSGGTINNCYSTGDIECSRTAGGFIGTTGENVTTGSGNFYDSNILSNACGSGTFSGVTGLSIQEMNSSDNLQSMGFTESNGWVIVNGSPRFSWENFESEELDGANVISLQVGTNSDKKTSVIKFDLSFKLLEIEDFLNNGIKNEQNIELIDTMIDTTSAKLVEYGAITNRLESVLEEIIISRDNLISSRSTLQDADIAEVSSEYIKQQILQQASATLMATANQSPAIALQLI